MQAFACDGLILTGGETPGAVPARDATERAALRFAMDRQIPVLGVCRGMQFILAELGAKIGVCNKDRHVARHHTIEWADPAKALLASETVSMRRVNSYHEYAVTRGDLPHDIECFAFCPDDGGVEALGHRERSLFGIMRHPEREPEPSSGDIALMRQVFRGGA